jgi:hypothetical protein
MIGESNNIGSRASVCGDLNPMGQGWVLNQGMAGGGLVGESTERGERLITVKRKLQGRFGSDQRAERFYREQVLHRLNHAMVASVARTEMMFIATSYAEATAMPGSAKARQGFCRCSTRPQSRLRGGITPHGEARFNRFHRTTQPGFLKSIDAALQGGAHHVCSKLWARQTPRQTRAHPTNSSRAISLIPGSRGVYVGEHLVRVWRGHGNAFAVANCARRPMAGVPGTCDSSCEVR